MRPDSIYIKNNGFFDMNALDRTVSKGSWDALEVTKYLNQKAKITKKP